MTGILAQTNGAAATEVLIYTAAGTTSITSLFIVNRGAASSFRVRAALNDGAAVESRQYLYFDTALPANETLAVSLAIVLGPGQSLYGYGTSANIHFVLFGGAT